jgi:hypothetical protein
MSDTLPPEWQSWLEKGARLLAVPPLRRSEKTTRGPEDPKFLLGDFLCSVPLQYIDVLAEALHAEPAQFRSYREVAEKIPPNRRVAAAWGVHRELKNQPEKLRPGLTIRDAAALLGKSIDSKADHNLTVAARVEKVHRFLDDPEVYAVIEKEIAQSRENRKFRYRARIVHSELAARQKVVEAELREIREAKSPFEAAVKAELDLLRAAQLAHAVGELNADLPQQERLAEALRSLADEVAAALEKFAPDDDEVIQGEAWQARSARAAPADSAQRFLAT